MATKDKGIRAYANAMFLRTLPTRVNDRLGNRNFRAAINTELMEQFGIPIHSAATAYNNAFIAAKEAAKTNEGLAKLLEGLGRPEDKKGGRKPKAKTEAVVPSTDNNDAGETGVEQTEFRVLKKKDNSVVAEGLTLEAAKEMVAANEGKRFTPKLYWA